MYRTCSVCGGIHEENHMCKRVYKKSTKESAFRNTNAWIKKRKHIKERDKYLCQMCLKDNVYTYKELQVHHIVPLAEQYDRRLDSTNLITLCRYHHEQAEKGLITKAELQDLINHPPGSGYKENNIFSTPTAHLHSHNFKFSVSFLENKNKKEY